MGKGKSREEKAVLAVFAESIKKHRGARSKKDFAASLGVEVSAVYRWEAGRSAPNLDAAILIARKLRISLGELAFGRDPLAEKIAALTAEIDALRALLRPERKP